MKLLNTTLMVISLAIAGDAIASGQVSAVKPISSKQLSKSKETQRYIVEFSAVSEVTKKRLLNQRSVNASAPRSSAQALTLHKQEISRQQTEFSQAVKQLQPNSKIKAQLNTVTNAVALETTLSIKELQSLSNVKAVYPVRRYSKKLANALPIVKAADAWQLVGGMEQAGKGMRIAVIDSGIVPTHPMFADDGFEAPSSNLPPDDYCRETDADFCNDKLIVARFYKPSFITDEYGEFDSPQGLSGHGTHVAGIATGRQVTADSGETISGVAPGAYLMVYKALWGQDGEGSDIELLSAIEDAVKDGADVINNSWGGGNGLNPINSFYNNIFHELEAAGVVLVTAAGNEGEDDAGNRVEKSIACPGCIEAGITVGATSTDLVFGLPVTYDSTTLYSQPSDTFSLNQSVTAQVVVAPESNTEGCTAWEANSLENKIALVNRGTCFFEEKATMAQNAGALALIVANNESEANFTMSMGEATLPAVMITLTDGNKLETAITNDASTEVSIAAQSVLTTDEQLQDWIGNFSSLGPNGDDSFIKPDLAAPGVAILSGASDVDLASIDKDYARFNGTSMATPIVAGAAAILKQANPTFNAIEIKNILINSSDAVVKNMTGSRAATAFETGAGRLNLLNALNTKGYAAQPNMTMKYCVVNCSLTNSLKLIGSDSQTWTASIEFDNDKLFAQVTPSQLQLTSDANEADFEVKVSLPVSLEQNWYFGRLIWQNEAGDKISQAIAVSNEQEDSPLLQASVSEKTDSVKTLDLVSTNISAEAVLDVELKLTGGAEFVTDSLTIENANTPTNLVEQTQLIEFSADVPKGVADIISGSVPIEVDLVAEGIEPIVCDFDGDEDGCDEVIFRLEFEFKHFGQDYTEFLLNDNGLIVAGSEIDLEAQMYNNKSFPNPDEPNNVIAPFWTDFNLSNPALDGDTGGGDLLVVRYTTDNAEYMVIQWDKAQLFHDPEQGVTAETLGVTDVNGQYTFQLILQKNSENKWFRYLSIPETPNAYTVGIENASGVVGTNYWHNGEGKGEIAEGDELTLALTDIGELAVSTDIAQTDGAEFAGNDTFSASEDEATELNLLANDLASGSEALLEVSVSNVKYFTQVFAGDDSVTLDKSSVTITTAPEHGELSDANEGLVTYTPSDNYSGADSFEYSVTNSLGQTDTATVNITVLAVNDAPVISELAGPTSVTSGESATYSVTATDLDDTALTYQWTLPSQLSGSGLTSDSIEVTANTVTSTTSVEISVTVSDGENDVTQSVTVAVEPASSGNGGNTDGGDSGSDSSSGGSLGVVLLTGLAFLSRRRKRAA